MLPPDLAAFVATTPQADWAVAPLAGDASTRRYWRLTGPRETAILMAAPPESLPPFLKIAGWLTRHGFAAPEALALDPAAGFGLFTDLGPEHLAARLLRLPAEEAGIYRVAGDLLSELSRLAPPDGLARIGPDEAGTMLAPFLKHYAPAGPGAELSAGVTVLWHDLGLVPDRLALRDFHAENLVWRPGAMGLARLGLLDFQDAVLAPAEYDLVSLLTDARRDLAPGLAAELAFRFGGDRDIGARMAAVSLARNLRILGIFARLARVGGKPRYLQFLPRVHGHVLEALRHPALAGLAGPALALAVAPEAVVQRLERA